MSKETFIEKKEESLATHIFSVSAALIGVCLTVIGIINIVAVFRKAQTIADDITILAVLLFLSSCILAYTSIKTQNRVRRLKMERCADVCFLCGLSLMALTCLFIVYFFVF